MSELISIIAIIVATLAWYKNRVIYEVDSRTNANGMDEVNKLLKTGKYTILHIKEDPLNRNRLIYILGKVKK